MFKTPLLLFFLDLSNKHLKCVTSLSVTWLAYLNLRNNHLTNIDKPSLAGLHNESEIVVTQHEICVCYVPSRINCSAANPRSP